MNEKYEILTKIPQKKKRASTERDHQVENAFVDKNEYAREKGKTLAGGKKKERE